MVEIDFNLMSNTN